MIVNNYKKIFLASFLTAALFVGFPVVVYAQSALEAFNETQPELPQPTPVVQEGGQIGIVNAESPELPPVNIQNNEQLRGVLDAANMTPEERQAEMEAQARDLAFDAAVNGLLPLRPDEIRRLLGKYDESTEAAQTPIMDAPEPEITVQTVSLDPGVAPPVIKVAPGHVTTLSMLDQSGEPWPIQDVSWGGDFDILQPEDGGHVLRISPLGAYNRGNLSIRLVDLNTPVTFMLQTHRDVVQYRFDARIPQYGPSASVPIIEQGGIKTQAGSATLVSMLDGVIPSGAKRMVVEGIDGRTSAYVLNSEVYLRTPYTLLSPAWSNSINSADGLKVYTIPETPVLLLSDNGKMVRATLSQKADDDDI